MTNSRNVSFRDSRNIRPNLGCPAKIIELLDKCLPKFYRCGGIIFGNKNHKLTKVGNRLVRPDYFVTHDETW